MEMDHEFSSSPPNIEPQLPTRRLKRLKKSDDSNKLPVDDPLMFSSVDFSKLEALDNDSLSNSEESEEMLVDAATKTKRILTFEEDDEVNVNAGNDADDDDIDIEKPDFNVLENKEWKTKNKRTKRDSGGGHELKAKAVVANKKGKEKGRKAYLEELHAESQRVLRETRNIAFEPTPVVKKPISSVLEKIRKRKLEIAKEFMIGRSSDYEESFGQSDSTRKTGDEMDEKLKRNIDRESSVDAPNVEGRKESPETPNKENECDHVLLDEVSTDAFRKPVNDTQDLFVDSEPNEISAKQNVEQLNNLLEEELVPPLLSMNLKLDSVLVDDSSSDEEDNDKENVSPRPRVITKSGPSPQDNVAKDFVDDEAEEDDSDHEATRFEECDEDEDIDDLEELNNMIATTFKEKPIDNEKRNELHQKWLEQQDAAGTDNLMQRLKFGTEVRDTSLLDEEPESEEDGEDFDNEVEEESLPVKSAKVNIRKAKQMILQFVSDKEDIYVSDDEEDAYSRVAHHRLLIRTEEQMSIVSPVDDEKSREVMGLIKNLNVVPDKKKPKTTSLFDSVLKGGNSNSSSKSSFLGRVSNHPIPSSRKQGSATYRSFIFGKDDSNSRSSVSVSEDSSDKVSQEAKTRNMSAKYSNNSQSKVNDRNRDGAPETQPGISLLDIMKPPSHSKVYHQQKSVDLRNISAFRAPKRFAKTELRR